MAISQGVWRHRPQSSFLRLEGEQAAEKESTEEVSASEQEQTDLPDKYKGKSTEEIIEMHQSAEKRLGQLKNEVGTYRGLVRDLSQLQPRQPESQPEEEETLEVSGDELINDPVGTIDKVVQRRTAKADRERQMTEDEKELQRESDTFFTDFPDAEDIIASEDFQTFAARTPSRQRDMQIAAGLAGDGIEQVNAARRLLEDYRDFQTVSAKQKKEDDPVEQAKRESTEDGSSTATRIEQESYSQDELVEMIQKDPAKWRSPSVQSEVVEAIKSGRYIPSA